MHCIAVVNFGTFVEEKWCIRVVTMIVWTFSRGAVSTDLSPKARIIINPCITPLSYFESFEYQAFHVL